MAENKVAAAAYVRMSTEDQKYSIVNQEAAIADYARVHSYEIVTIFTDPGISGLDLRHRPGLKALLNNITSGAAQFTTVLVLDVSRWGRFQDIDESAYYEFLCRQSGVRVQYCAEAFDNDQSPYSNLVKAIKRTMAAEYSRELGVKVFRGQMRLASLGYKQGGAPCLGLRRLLVDSNGNAKQVLKNGERKHLVSDHVRLIAGPDSEIRFVRSVFQSFLAGRSIPSIARELRRRKRFGRSWTPTGVTTLLTNQQYVGTYVYNRTTTKLRTSVRRNPRTEWILTPGAVEPLVPENLFNAAQERMANFTVRLSNEELLRRLRDLWKERGFLTARMIDRARSRGVPNASVYRNRFGGLANALRLIGFKSSERGLTKRRLVANLRRSIWEALKAELVAKGIHLREKSWYPYQIHIAGAPLMNFMLAHPLHAREEPTWEIRPPRPAPIGSCVIGVLSRESDRIIEYAITGTVRKTPTRSVKLTIPLLCRVSLARFRSPEQFRDAMERIGYLNSKVSARFSRQQF